MTAALRLEKYHGLGNDFLVLVDLDDGQVVDAALASALCDRRRGVGADGLIRVTAGPADAGSTAGPSYRMELYNADGGRAEMSGNGIRCLARALVDVAGETRDRFIIATDAGPRTVSFDDDGMVTADMGPVVGLRIQASRRGYLEAGFHVGNFHVVVAVEDPAKVDLLAEAAIWGDDTNVEVVAAGPGPDEITMRVHERGVGETLACGTGACAAAVAARDWGLAVGQRVVVHQPGGALVVDLSGPTIALSGPAVRVGTVEVAETWLRDGPTPSDGPGLVDVEAGAWR